MPICFKKIQHVSGQYQFFEDLIVSMILVFSFNVLADDVAS